MKLSVFFDFTGAYFRLSPTGRRWLRSRLRTKEPRPKRGRFPLLKDRESRRDIIHKLLICDSAFRDNVSDDQLRILGRERRRVYGRFVPFAFINLLIYGRLLEAYGIAYDRPAEARLAKFIFLWREWNDLREHHSLAIGLVTFQRGTEPQPPFLLLRTLIDTVVGRDAPPEEYPAFANYLRAFMERRPAFLTAQPTEIRIKEAAVFLVMTGYSVMFKKIPEILIEPVRDFAPWFYSLDELSDLHRDKAAKKATHFGKLEDPEKEIWGLYAIREERFRKEACAPERILSLMKFLTEETIRTVRMGFDIESELFGAPPCGASIKP